MPFGNSEMDVPEGQMKIAQRFNAVSAYRGRTRRAATSSAASSGAKASRKRSGPCEAFRRCTRRGCRSATTATDKQILNAGMYVTPDKVPKGRLKHGNDRITFGRPFGTRIQSTTIPALKRRAIAVWPSGTDKVSLAPNPSWTSATTK